MIKSSDLLFSCAEGELGAAATVSKMEIVRLEGARQATHWR